MSFDNEIWTVINDTQVIPDLLVSTNGNFLDVETMDISPSYHSSNGYTYHLLNFTDSNKSALKRVDFIVAWHFLDIPDELIGSPLDVEHIDGNLSNNCVSNLRWIRDVERWESINCFNIVPNRYEISSWGNIRSQNFETHSGRYINNGYKLANLKTINGLHHKHFLIHRLVAATFINPNIGNLVINHIDGNIENNDYHNLEVVTIAENNKHASLTGLRLINISNIDRQFIRKMLVKLKGSPVAVLKACKENGITGVTEETITHTKLCMRKEGFKFPQLCRAPMGPQMISDIKRLLIENDGDFQYVYRKIKSMYPNEPLTIHNIKTVKASLKSSYRFKDLKRNRKISETERSQLIQILKNTNWSPAEAYRCIQNNESYKHVTVYDLKYLKRKYFEKS